MGLFKTIGRAVRDLDNFFFFVKQLREMEDSNALKQYGLKRVRNRLYAVVNLKAEFLLSFKGADLAEVEKTYVGNEVTKYNLLFEKYDIYELYLADYERIQTDEFYAYALQIRYRWRVFIRAKIIRNLIIATLIAGAALALFWALK